MENNNEKKDYIIRLDKAKKNRNKNDYKKILILTGSAILLVSVVAAAGITASRQKNARPAAATGSEALLADTKAAGDADEKGENEAELKAKEEVINSYKNLGIVQVSGYLNVRKEPGTDADVSESCRVTVPVTY